MENTELSDLQPIIVLGAHRSGTTMITQMLRKLGLFAGNDLEPDHDESMYFQECNEWLLNQASASWDSPTAFQWLLSNDEVLALVHDYLRYRLGHWPVRRYLGMRRYVAGQRPLSRMVGPWGWKDPRNTFTLPIWLRLFPQAKVIHIYRNGVAVAASLRTRDRGGLAAGVRNHHRRLERGLYRWFRKRGGFVYSVRCLDLHGGFSLWREYVNEAFRLLAPLSGRAMSVKYEDFVVSPVRWLAALAEFCGISASASSIEGVAAGADPGNLARFASDGELIEFQSTVKDDHWMRKLGYG